MDRLASTVGRTLRTGGLVVVVALLAVPVAAAGGAQPFINGVAAGEITSRSAVLWGQLAHDGNVRAQVATDAAFQNVVADRAIRGKAKDDNTFQPEIHNLSPDTTYRYRFCQGQTCSEAGRFTTAPAAGAAETIRFAYSGDETGVSAPGQNTPFWGQMKAFAPMVAENNDFNIDFGDTIYSDPEVPGAPTARTVPEKWQMYRAKLALPNQRAVREATGIYAHWDDHEFINDFSRSEDGDAIYKAGVEAFRDYQPVSYSNHRGLYRSFRWGRNLELFFLDQRSFRDAKASANGVCDNPATGEPDLAPTAPTATRNLFSALVPSLSEPVSKACLDAINDPDRTLLGEAQLRRFLDDVESSPATWKVVMNETPIQQFYALPYDRWEGYAYERVRMMRALDDANVSGLVFMTTDTHAGFANVIRYRTLAGDSAPTNVPSASPAADTPYRDFVIGPVATKPFWEEIGDETGNPATGPLVSNVFFKPPPPNGMGMACAQGGENSYAEVTVTGSTLRVEYKDEDGNQLLDSNGSTPCGPYELTP